MAKKLALLAMSVTAFLAFAVPTFAQAEVTNANGEPANSLTAVSSNTVTTTSLGNLECENVTLGVALSENSASNAKGSGSGTASGCLAGGSIPLTITSITVENIEAIGGSGTAAFAFTYNLLGSPCTLKGSTAVSYAVGSSSLHIAGSELVGSGGGLCPTKGGITGDFTVSEAGGGAVSIG